jgi:hypothetical protein
MDPYPSASRELEQKVQSIEQSLSDWKAIRSSNSSATGYTRQKTLNDISGASTLQKALEDSFRFISQNPRRFPDISPPELANRRSFVAGLSRRLQSVRTQIEKAEKAIPAQRTGTNREELLRRAGEEGNQRFIDSELEEQQKMLREQDNLIDIAGESSGMVLEIAKGIGEGLKESNVRLGGTSERMDRSKSGIDQVTEKVTGFLKKRSTWLWLGCVVLTTIALVLLICVIL